EYRAGEISEHALMGRKIGLEAMLVVEEELQPLTLQDQGIERRKNMDSHGVGFGLKIERLGSRPMPGVTRALEVNSHELAAASLQIDHTPDRGPACDTSIADRIQADESLRPQCPLEDIAQRLALRGRAGQSLPAEVARRQLIRLQHSRAPADGDQPLEEGELQRPLGRLATRPGMTLVDEHVIVDVADGEGSIATDARQDSAQISRRH